MSAPPLLKAEKLARILPGEVPVTLVHGVSLEIARGEFIAITGPSGSGKSSLLYLLGLLDMPSSGHLWLNGTETSSYGETELAGIRLKELGFVFQFHFLLPEFSALENVMLPMQRLGQLKEADIRHRAEALLERMGMAEQRHKLPRQLSGGQSQRVAIARALANDPQLILADEPTGNLDTASSTMVQQILRGLAGDHRRTVITVTHEPDFAQTADRILHIVDGTLQDGTPQIA